MVDILGPSSQPFSLKAFASEVDTLTNEYPPDAAGPSHYKSLSAAQRAALARRMDCSDLCATGDRVFSQPQRVIEYGIWQRARYLAGSDDPALLAAMQERILGNSRPAAQTPTSARPKKPPKTKKRKGGPGDEGDELTQIDPSLQPDEEQAEPGSSGEAPAEDFRHPRTINSRTPVLQADNSIRPSDGNAPRGLQIYAAFAEAQHYVRWTRKADSNTLLDVRLHPRGAAAESGVTNEDISQWRVRNEDPGPAKESPLLLTTWTSHPLVSAKFTARHQRIVLLSSQTLLDLRDALVCPVDALPAESTDPPQEDEGRAPRYQNRPFEGGAVFLMEKTLYPDTRPGRADMAQCLQAQMAHVDWSTGFQPKVDPYTRDGIDVDGSGGRPAYSVSDRGMESVKIGELTLRIGQPYWLYHQGSCEHVLTLDEVRAAHPGDRTPLDGPLCPYPLTTMLSRLGADKCRICNRDPATKILVDDELAGETPALCCDICFWYFHGEGGELAVNGNERARQMQSAERHAALAGTDVIPILESLNL